MVPLNNYTAQLDTEEDDYVSSEPSQDYENVTNDQENTRISTVSSLKSVAFDVSSFWAKVLISY